MGSLRKQKKNCFLNTNISNIFYEKVYRSKGVNITIKKCSKFSDSNLPDIKCTKVQQKIFDPTKFELQYKDFKFKIKRNILLYHPKLSCRYDLEFKENYSLSYST